MTLIRSVLLTGLMLLGPPQTPQLASIQGVIREAITGRPLENVTVELGSLGNGYPYIYTALTSNDGTFAMPFVSPGEYRLRAKRSGYFSMEYGQHRWNGTGIPISVAGGESLKGLQIQLTAGGSLSGRITDMDGDPAAAQVVQATIVSNKNGHRAYEIVKTTTTNDLGEYRFFELHPGSYLVSAAGQGSAPNSSIAGLLTTPGQVLVMPSGISAATTFFPGTPDPRSAAVFDVTSGVAIQSGNFTIRPVLTRHVRGIVQGNGASVQLAALSPLPTMSSLSGLRSVDSRNGSFDIPDVLPGDYLLIAKSVDKEAKLKIDVRDLDVDNLILDLRAGVFVRSNVHIAGRPSVESDPAFRYIRFNLSSEPAIEGVRGPIYSTFPDGTLNLELFPGERYRLSLVAAADAPPEIQDTYIRSIKMGSREVLNDGFEFNGEPDAKVEIVIGIGVGTLSGAVTEDGQAPAINTVVVLVPDVARRGRTDMYKTATSDGRGQFQITQIAPGDYRAFAWNDVDDGEWMDPAFMSRYEERGTPVHIEETTKLSITLQSIR